MADHTIDLKKSFWGHKYNYIYLIYCLSEDGFLYIGQTGQRYGVIGRLGQHLDDGTLIQQAEKRGVDIFAEDLTLEYFLLKNKVFEHRSYRESLEAAIQRFIPEISDIEIISSIVHNNYAYVKHKAVKDFLKKIKNRLENIFLR